MPDFSFADQGLVIQCKYILGYPVIENLVAAPQTDGFGASGQFFSALDQARQQLITEQKEAAERFEQFVARLQAGINPQIQQLPSALSFEQLLEVINQQPRFTYIPPVSILRFLQECERVRNLLRRVFARISKVLKAKRQSKPRFCGLSWSRRLWFLLHGSHPPKTECCQAFGCA